MPGGKIHEMINAAVLLAVLSGIYYIMKLEGTELAARYLDTNTILAFSVSYLFATFFLSPDLDIKSKPYRRWKMLRILWWPYKTVFKHRGFSHNLIIGPLSIMLNLALIVLLLFLLTGADLHEIQPDFIVAATAGMILSMEVHIISDSCISKIKNWF